MLSPYLNAARTIFLIIQRFWPALNSLWGTTVIVRVSMRFFSLTD
jgi:hypothetical protein